MIKQIIHDNIIYAIIIPSEYSKEDITFFTPDEYSQQLAYMNHKMGKIIQPHIHNVVSRQVYYTQEVLFIKKGKIRIDFFDNEKKYFESHIISQGDIILLASGGHGFEIIEDAEMIEVKQGPYVGEMDKTRFDGIKDDEIIIRS